MIQTFGLAGIIGYAIILSFYDRFYDALGVRPEDVGMDRTAIISRTAGSFPFWIFTTATVWATILLIRIVRLLPQSPASLVTLIGVYIVAASLPVAFLVAQTQALNEQIDFRALQVISGTRVEPIKYLGLTMVDLRGEPAEVDWVGDAEKRPYVIDTKIQRLIYLGQRDGIAILIANEAETVRVPASNVVITFLCVKIGDNRLPITSLQRQASTTGSTHLHPGPQRDDTWDA